MDHHVRPVAKSFQNGRNPLAPSPAVGSPSPHARSKSTASGGYSAYA